MRLSLKAKLTALITVLVLLVVVVTSTIHISNLTRQALQEVESRGEYVASEVSHQASAALKGTHMPEGENPQDFQALRSVVQTRLSSDPEMKSLMESAVGYSPVVDYVAISDTNLVVLISYPDELGHHLMPAPHYSQLLHAGVLRQIAAIYGPPTDYEVTQALAIGANPLGDVRVGVSTVLLRGEIAPRGCRFCVQACTFGGPRWRTAWLRSAPAPAGASGRSSLEPPDSEARPGAETCVWPPDCWDLVDLAN